MENSQYKIMNIETAIYNNKPVKIFDVYENNESKSAWVFLCKSVASEKVADNDLLADYLENQCD